jgi:hypothetical protein
LEKVRKKREEWWFSHPLAGSMGWFEHPMAEKKKRKKKKEKQKRDHPHELGVVRPPPWANPPNFFRGFSHWGWLNQP